MDRKYVSVGGIVAFSIALGLTACQPNKKADDSTTVASKPASKQVPASESPKANDSHVGTGPIIELTPAEVDDNASSTIASPPAALELEMPATTPAVAAPETAAPVEVGSVDPQPTEASAPSVALAPIEASEVPPEAASNVAATAASTTESIATADRVKPALGNTATEAELNQQIAVDWPKPQAVIYVSGQQQGYIEPCGCTGLDSQKGGLIRRDTVLATLRDRGWEILPVDVGNQNRQKRSTGPQPQIKFATTAKAMQMMDYKAVGLGVHDLELSRVELINIGASDPEGKPGAANDRPFICGNVVVYSEPNFFPAYRIVEAGGRKIGITSVIGKEFEKDVVKPGDDEVEFFDPVERLKKIVPELKSQGCDFIVLLAHATLNESAELGSAVDGIDLVVTAGGYGEPTLLPEPIKDSKAVMVQVGTKGMYGGIIGIFDDPTTPIRYQKIAISSQFKDSDRMLKLFAEYQDRLKEAGFAGLGLTPALHPSGRTYVGSETCGECHTQAYDIWKDTPHFHATDSIVAANNDRGGIERHFDPECVSCHATGWNPQQFTPFQTGYASLNESKHLLGSGCENCHGPGSAHVEAEQGSATTEEQTEYRQEMILTLAKAEAKCMECHDFDNSPDFHAPGAFEKYWERVKHYGKA